MRTLEETRDHLIKLHRIALEEKASSQVFSILALGGLVLELIERIDTQNEDLKEIRFHLEQINMTIQNQIRK